VHKGVTIATNTGFIAWSYIDATGFYKHLGLL